MAGSALALSLGGALVTALAAALLPRRHRPGAVGIGTSLVGLAALVAGVGALVGQRLTVALPDLLPLFGLRFTLDPLAGLFVAVTGGVAMAAGIYGIGYAAHGGSGTRIPQTALPVFVAAMVLVPVADSIGTLVVCWELMAFSSLILVATEHRQRASVTRAVQWYAVMTHLGLVGLMVGLLVFAQAAVDGTFAALRASADELSPLSSSLVFLLTFTGFASKAGIVPVHAWLPRAHPEAPSHVSALMSAAMVNLGAYGIVRVGFDLLGGGPMWWWLVVLGLGAVSAVYGILQAAMGTDIKRLLGYSTTENLGLILVAVGAAGVLTTAGKQTLGGLALAAGLLHVVNHAAFKTLLFLAAGSVVHTTGTRDLDALGGLRARMPVTTGLFALGALCASALPPGNGFVSEWLLLQSLVHGLPDSHVVVAVTMPVAVAVIALTAGLAVATFVKAFGIGFLARPRGEAAASASEASPTMVAGMALAGLMCVGLSVLPTVLLPGVSGAVGAAGLAFAAGGDWWTIGLQGLSGALSPLLLVLALLLGVLALAVVLRLLLGLRRATRPGRREARLWDCGGGPLSARMEYTATSFAEPLGRVFDNVLEPETDVDVTHLRESRYLVDRVEFRRRVPDRVERRLYAPVLALARRWGTVARRIANGSIHRYLGYGFASVTGLLVLLVVTR